jgi:hypothetical protein
MLVCYVRYIAMGIIGIDWRVVNLQFNIHGASSAILGAAQF